MAIEFKLPEVSEGVESADVAEILVSEGDTITEGQIVMEIETEKAVVELPCPHAGKVEKIHVASGDTVQVGGLLLSIAESSSSAKESAQAERASAARNKKQENRGCQERNTQTATVRKEIRPAEAKIGQRATA